MGRARLHQKIAQNFSGTARTGARTIRVSSGCLLKGAAIPISIVTVAPSAMISALGGVR